MLKISFPRTTRRAVLLASTLALVVGAVPAQAEGVWNTSMDFNGQAIEATLTITKSADGSLQGVWQGQQGAAELSNVKFDDGKLTFNRTVNFGDQQFAMSFSGTIAGDKLNGEFLTDFGGMAISGSRAAVEAVAEKPKSPLQGTWELTSVSQMGEIKRNLVVAADLSGVYEGDGVKWPIQNLKLDGDKVTFDVTISIQDQELALSFAGKLENNKITGKYSIGGMGEVADVTGVKVEKSPLVAMVGTWSVTTTTEQGDLPGTLIVKEDLSGTMGNDEMSFPIKDLRIEEGYITFRLAIDMQGNQISMEFWGNIDGDGMLGGTIDIDGQVIADLYGGKKK